MGDNIVLVQEVDGELTEKAGIGNPVAFALAQAAVTANAIPAEELAPLRGKHLRVTVEIIDEDQFLGITR